ncbi:histidinol-phosphate transaminase [Thalassotalea profundi]|uniref:Histidinol-phosphate aminotransferase n=1 Tax=Thalassotalea profundi TaxID=2036687 RepID=A0ABQ3IEU1_9GAMM|nr:histidinol-phosphate transaminase [Thalassotalea profundi]GHE78491.1 histidinol-phosphate aminotransferase [Thalassotalea profundi]
MSIANKLARAELVDMIPYQSARRLQAGNGSFNSKIWLNANEASGPGIYQVNSDCINRYPDFQPDNLLNAYSAYCNLEKSQILATRGADEGIELLIRTFCKAYQDNILICPPTYGMYAISAENHGAGITKVPLIDCQLDLAGLKEHVGKVKVVFLCSPGNPTGNLLAEDQIKSAIEMFADSAIVVVDEAYIEFSPEKSAVAWLDQYPNLVVLRTLSKAFALAGLRCGFTLANNDIITMLSKVIAPYPVPAPIAEIASSVLSEDGLAQMRIRVQETTILRQQLITWLSEQTWCSKVYSSDANFVLFACKDKDEIFNILAEQGILIRDQSKQLQLNSCLRISIGSEREIAILKQTLTNALTDITSPVAEK